MSILTKVERINSTNPADISEKASDFCLAPLRNALGYTKLTLDKETPTRTEERASLIVRIVYAVFAFLLALPLTLIGLLFLSLSSSHKNACNLKITHIPKTDAETIADFEKRTNPNMSPPLLLAIGEYDFIGSGKIKKEAHVLSEYNRLKEFFKTPATATDNFFSIGYGNKHAQKWNGTFVKLIRQNTAERTFSVTLFELPHYRSGKYLKNEIPVSDRLLNKLTVSEFTCGFPIISYGNPDPSIKANFYKEWNAYVNATLAAGKKIYIGDHGAGLPDKEMLECYNKAKQKYPNQIFLLLGHENFAAIPKGLITEDEIRKAYKFSWDRTNVGIDIKTPAYNQAYIDEITKAFGDKFEFMLDCGEPSIMIT